MLFHIKPFYDHLYSSKMKIKSLDLISFMVSQEQAFLYYHYLFYGISRLSIQTDLYIWTEQERLLTDSTLAVPLTVAKGMCMCICWPCLVSPPA